MLLGQLTTFLSSPDFLQQEGSQGVQIIEFSYEERTTAEHFYSHHEVAAFQADNHAAQDDAVEAHATEALDMENVHDCRDTFEACRAAVRTMYHAHVLSLMQQA